jgi:hypothetical protein
MKGRAFKAPLSLPELAEECALKSLYFVLAQRVLAREGRAFLIFSAPSGLESRRARPGHSGGRASSLGHLKGALKVILR